LDRELNRLADKYRVPVVLLRTRGRSRREAAELLGIRKGRCQPAGGGARIVGGIGSCGAVSPCGGGRDGSLSQREASASVPASLIARAVSGATADSAAPAVVALFPGSPQDHVLRKLQLSAVVSILGRRRADDVCLVVAVPPGQPTTSRTATHRTPATARAR